MTKKAVLLYKHLNEAQRERLENHFHIYDFTGIAGPATNPAFRETLANVHGVLSVGVPFTRELLSCASNLEAISSVSVGVDSYDVDYLNQQGILLCHTPDVLTETTADTAFLLILAAARRGVELATMVREGKWQSSIDEKYFGIDVHGKNLGIIGMGRIGAAIGQRAHAGFSMNVAYHSGSRHADMDAKLDATWLPLDELLNRSDFVCVTVPLLNSTRGMFNAEQFRQMSRDAIFVNVSRGGVVNEPALIEALENGIIRAAGLDVYETEPLPPDSPLTRLNNVVTLPHVGSATHETRRAMAELAIDNLVAALAGRKPSAAYNWTQVANAE